MSRPPHHLIFGVFSLDPHSLELEHDGRRVSLAPQPARVLSLLVSHAGELVTREEIRDHVWGDQAVEFDTGLHSCIRQIRRVLSDDANSPSFIETIPRRGYRFIAPVKKLAVPAPEEPSTTRAWPRFAIGAVIAAILIVATIMLAPRPVPASTPAEVGPYRLVVLPFDNMLTETDTDHLLVPALDEEIRTELSRLDPKRLGVIARTSSQRLRSSELTVREIGNQLDVTHLLEGAVRRVNGGLTITVRLVSVADETQVWADRFVRPRGDADFALDVAQHVTSQLVPELLPALKRYESSRPSVSPEALRATLEARYLLQEGDPDAAQKRLDRALELAPDHAQARALQADVMVQSSRWDDAEVEARRALELDPGQARASRVLGDVEMYGRLRIAPAGPWYQRAATLAPTDPEALMAWGWWLIVTGETDAAIDTLNSALSWDPVSPILHGDGPWFYFFARRFDQALDESRRGIELLTELQTGSSCQLAVALVRRDTEEMVRLFKLPNRADASKYSYEPLLRTLIKNLTNTPNVNERASRTAKLHALLGEPDAAFDQLAEAFENRDTDLIFLTTDPRLDNLRGDPRFDQLVARVAALGDGSPLRGP